jgi:hypothetical protein
MQIYGETSLLNTLPIRQYQGYHSIEPRSLYIIGSEKHLIPSIFEPLWPDFLRKSNFIGQPSYHEHPHTSCAFICLHENFRMYESINKAIFIENNLIIESLGGFRTYDQIVRRWPQVIGTHYVDANDERKSVRLVKHSDKKIEVPKPTSDGSNSRILLFSPTPDDKNVHHFIYEAIPRVLPFINLPTNSIKLFFSYKPTTFQIELLNILGIHFQAVFPNQPADVHFEEAILSTYTDPSFGDQSYVHWLRNRIVTTPVNVQDHVKKLLIHRSDSLNRQVSNREEMITYYSAKGFVPITMSRLSAAQQVSLFLHADEIVFETGAAGAFLAFCQPGIKVTELSPPPEYFGSFNGISPIQWLLSLTAGLNYNYKLLVYEGNKLYFKP